MKSKDQAQYPDSFHIKAIAETREVWLNGQKLKVPPAIENWQHMPKNFGWGLDEAGSTLLAIVITEKIYGPEFVDSLNLFVKWRYVSTWPGLSDLDITVDLRAFNSRYRLEKLAQELSSQ